MPRAGLAPASVIAAGAALADEIGFANLSMGLVAERVGVRTPSLYKHIESLDALRRGVAASALRDFGEVLVAAVAGRSGAEAIHAFAGAYRRWALEHPGRYAATVRAPQGDDGVRILFDVLAGFERSVDAARVLRSALHGFATLEAAGGFGLPEDVTRSFSFLVDAVINGLRATPGRAGRRAGRPSTRP